MRKVMASIDLGSDTIKLLVAELIKDKVHVLTIKDIKTKSIKDGLITSEEGLIEELKNLFKQTEETLGLKIHKVLVNVNPIDSEFSLGEGVTTITNSEKVVGGADIVRVLQASVYNKIPNNMELATILPISFIADDNKEFKNPRKITASKLKVKTIIITVSKKNIYQILSCFEKLGIEVTDLIVSPIGDYYTYKTEETDNSIGAIINLGEDTTTVSVFNKGILTNSETINLGASNLVSDISFIYKVNKKDAIFLKNNLALAHKRLAEVDEVEELANKLGETIKINQFELSEICMSRISEILNLAKKQINLLTKKEISYIIITGGLSELPDFSILVEETFSKNVLIGKIDELGIRNNRYSVVLGMIKYFNEKLKLRDKSYSIFDTEEQGELGEANKRISVNNDSLMGKIFGYFFDN